MKILHIANRRTQIPINGLFASALRKIGDLQIVEQGKDLCDGDVTGLIRDADVLITNWASRRIPDAVVEAPGKLRYVLNLGGTCKATVPIALIRAGIPVTNWGDKPAQTVAEGAMALLLAVLKDLRPRTENLVAGKGAESGRQGLPSGSLQGLKVGLYGCGVIGSRFVEMLRPFKPEVTVFDPYADTFPYDCRKVDSLDALFEDIETLVIWAGLSDETAGSITAALLGKLPDHGIVINAARGEIIDQDALFKELKSGRLRAGLDVLIGDDYLPKGHEAHTWPNLLITSHDISKAHWPQRPPALGYGDQIALDNLTRFVNGEPLRFLMDEKRYHLSS